MTSTTQVTDRTIRVEDGAARKVAHGDSLIDTGQPAQARHITARRRRHAVLRANGSSSDPQPSRSTPANFGSENAFSPCAQHLIFVFCSP